MKHNPMRLLGFLVLLVLAPMVSADPLPSWNDSSAKMTIQEFVAAVTDASGPHFIPPSERIAVFDNDGALWIEQPMYVQLAFALDRVKTLAPQHPEWQTQQPFKAVLEGDLDAFAEAGKRGLVEMLMATHAGMTEWIANARHPKYERPYTELVYQPMLELLDYLRANGFKTFIVSGGGIEFMRPWVKRVYGIPPEQVIGSSIEVQYEVRNGKPVLVRLPQIDFINDKAGKPVGIHRFIGSRPVPAFGNSDGDLQMLQWTTAGDGPRLGLILHHDDAAREYAYDRESHFGRLDKALEEAPKADWMVVSMKNDWKQVFPANE